MNQIERMNRLRRNLLNGILWASGIWAGILVIWIGIVFNRLVTPAPAVNKVILLSLQWIVFASAVVVLFFLLKFWAHKWKFRKEPALRSAIDDERVRLCWLKAYRFAFFVVIGFHSLLLFNQAIGSLVFRSRGIILPQFAEIPLTLLLAVLSCLGSFLHYSREN